MGRYTGPACRLCRREGMKLFLKGDRCNMAKCPIDTGRPAPGMHGARRTKASDYSKQFREKQRLRRFYGLQDGLLRGPIPLLDDGYIISAYDAESFGVLLGQRIKHGVKGDKDHTVPWADIVKQFKRATGK